MDPCWFRISVDHEAVPLSLVAAIRLHALGGTGRWSDHQPVSNILFAANAAERGCRGQVVGKFRMEEYCGRADDSSQDARSGRNFWTKHVVMIL